MSSPASPRSLAASRRLYRILLRLYPAEFRRRHGAAMEQLFRDACRDAYAERGLSGLFGIWGHTLGDLTRTLLREHRDALSGALRRALWRREVRLAGPLPLPAPGAQVRVIPVVQRQTQPPWTLTLVSLENWEGVCIANFGLTWASPPGQPSFQPWEPVPRGVHPDLALRITDDRGRRYRTRPSGGSGGGTPDGGRMDLSYTLIPALPAEAHTLRFDVRVQLMGRATQGPGMVPQRKERERWTFAVALPPRPAAS
jgi:hypothetical protein